MQIKTPRSIYAGKLREFPDIARGDAAAFERRGRWGEFFRERIGPAFDGRLIVEIGCADAAFLGSIAAKHPATAFVGLDWKCKALYDAAKRITAMGLRNVSLIRGHGQDVARIFGPREVDEIWVFHPDPCDRPVELKNRLIGEPFLADAHSILRGDESAIVLKTDHPGYYQWTLALFGRPQPWWFEQVLNDPKAATIPRTRVRDVLQTCDLPQTSEAILQSFELSDHSADYWQDSAAKARSAHRCFAGSATPFEQRFIRKRLPIYYVEMRRKAD